MFTKTEKTILNALPKKYKCIFRSSGGELIISVSENEYYYMSMFNHIFKDVKPGCEPIRFREPILDDAEREYLKTVFKPFASRIKYVAKQQLDGWGGTEYIYAITTDPSGDGLNLPAFKAGTMYKGMEPNKEYTLDELEITYD